MSENMTPELAALNDLYAYYLNARCRSVEQMPTKLSPLLATAMGAVDECERAPILTRADFKSRIEHLLTGEAYPRPSSEPVVVTHHNTFNIKDGDTNAIVAAFNKVTKPPESQWQTFVDAAIGLGLRAHVDGATGEVKVVSPSTYYLDKGPKNTPTSAVDHAKDDAMPSWAERLFARTIGPMPGPGESLAGRRFKLIEVLGEG